MTMRDEPVYPMGVSERLTGLTRRRIRYYELAGLISPHRTAGRHRLYTPAEIETLQTVRLLSERGYHTVEAIRRRLSALTAAGERQALAAQPALRWRGDADDSGAYFGRARLVETAAEASAAAAREMGRLSTAGASPARPPVTVAQGRSDQRLSAAGRQGV